jgi:glycosyltransferase involved in cell wall biosynthesis
MRIALLVDAYRPARTSAAVQMADLARALADAGHEPTVVVPDAELEQPWALEQDGCVRVLRLRAPRTKDLGRVRRALAESLLPWAMARNLARSPLRAEAWQGVVWYSPTIFLGALAWWMGRARACRRYLILRDLFPDWAVDAGLMRRGAAYAYFKAVEFLQYAVAHVIGVQTPANLPLLARWARRDPRRVEVLHNWLAARPAPARPAAPRDEVVFVYAGNMGLAQGMDSLLALAQRLASHPAARFLFVGRGTEVAQLKTRVQDAGLRRVEFRDEVDPDALPAVLADCDVGLIALDPRHRTHNIPGKLLTYLHAGLPVLACINPGNDLGTLIESERVGHYCTGSIDELERHARALLDDATGRSEMGARGRALALRMFSPQTAASQLLSALRPSS